MVAFLACLTAGVVAVPVFPPNPLRRDTLHMFATIVSTCQAAVALTNQEYNYTKQMAGIRQKLQTQYWKKQRPHAAAKWPEDLPWMVTTNNNAAATKSGKSKSSKTTTTTTWPRAQRDQLAFLQFTSGSTSAPKGVMITHGNLAHNLSLITAQLQATDDTVVVSWLPQYHDMGLIGSGLGLLYCGGSGYYLSPLSFLQRPMLWMEAVAKYQATHLQAPNFCFKLTARKFVEEAAAEEYDDDDAKSSNLLQLGSVRHIINAAEPVDEDSMEVFYHAFGKFGLQKGVIYPTYGLAEHTVFVCTGGQQRLTVDKRALEVDGRVVVVASDGKSRSGESSSRLVGCGYPARQEVDLQIVDTTSFQALPEDKVGEIWIRSASKAAGYYQMPEETKVDFHGQLADATTASLSDGYLRTGDLGFLHRDELFICGRLKDLIIVGGRNYYPQDLEATAEAASDLVRPGCSAAFTIDPTHEGGEEVALVAELKDGKTLPEVCAKLANQIRGSVNQEHSLGVKEVVLLKPRTVPKTSSGKIARAWCRKAYLGGTLEVVYRKSFKAQSSSPLELDSNSNNGAPITSAVTKPLSKNEAIRIRTASKEEILAKLVTDVSLVGSIPESAVDKKAPLVTMLDSLTISQFKGLLENSYAVKISDEYLFRESSTLLKLVEVVKLGHAPDDGDGDAAANAAVSSAPSGNAGGLAGALGCPPGVRCVIL